MKKVLYYILLGCMLVAGLPACTDDPLMDGGGEIPEGETTLSAVINFKPFGEALTGKSRSAGDAIKSINNLCVLFYADVKEGDKTVKKLAHYQYYDGEGLTVENVDRTSDKEQLAESKTPQAKFSLTIPYGKYYAYVVANMGDLNAENSLYKEALQTPEGLKSIKLNWNCTSTSTPGDETGTATKDETVAGDEEEMVKTNNQMFGCFTTSSTLERPKNFEAPLLTIDKSVTTLHAWIRRAASKVTVAYDARGLKDNVRLHIHSVQIKDIPRTCLLGDKNTPSEEGQLISDGEIQYYYPNKEDDPKKRGLYLSNGPTVSIGGSKHEETEPMSLFFFENMQGDESDGLPNKYQDKTGENTSVTHPGSYEPDHEFYKDKVKFGSYIEVKGYYESDNPDRVGEGPIIYRFMLGKDIHKDYNAERNYHYKLTLKFKGFANDVDWHIEYEEPQPGVYVTSPHYISYLYDRTMNINVKVVGEMMGDLRAEIIENNWGPLDPKEENVYYNQNGLSGKVIDEKGENGFLSLRKTNTTVVNDATAADASSKHQYNLNYYIGNLGVKSRKERIYLSAIGSYSDSQDGDYSVAKTDPSGITPENEKSINTDPGKTFTIPLYTRARSLVPWTGYTGNNIYVAYRRKAVIRFTASIKYAGVTKEYSDEVEILQSRRIVNPKGVWRSWDNSAPFQVRILYLPELSATRFEDLISDGPWRAEVVDAGGARDWLKIEATGHAEQGDNEFEVKGGDQTNMEFKILPQGTLESKDAEPRCGIVRLYYNNYTCVHLIFVRQGYAPLKIADSGPKWHSFNVYRAMLTEDTKNETDDRRFMMEETTDPRDEGSYFRWRQNAGILASNNRTYSFAREIGMSDLETTEGKKQWGNISGVRADDIQKDSWVLEDEPKMRVATLADFLTIYSENQSDAPVQYGFGVLYADGANDTQYETSSVNGYYGDLSESERKTKGMRGCFVYNNVNCNNIFFPIGAEGHGRRKAKKKTNGDAIGVLQDPGILRYANRNEAYTTAGEIIYRPLFFDLYRRPGAIYWCRDSWINNKGNQEGDKRLHSAWDINYYTLNFSEFESNAYDGETGESSDACLMRLVED
ncbi:hypothetical protein [uncultured Phocaeicola sp.]|uniref:hypothetical protein n=1 Tax=uncultured Phocaeicola sp. TaxID=990718 RepID=UPI001433BF75|nr:hypothetical protein [uncultured Phocaeicola sp.]GFI01048.1 hypothetical protein IMSAGC004_03459 [Bacteroidaceae bacterium]